MDMSDNLDPAPVQVPVVKNRGGEWVRFGDEMYRVPPLSFRSLQELADEVEGLKDMVRPTAAQMTTIEKIVHSALVRNYPAMTVAEVSDMMDVGNYEHVLSAALSIAGFTRARETAPGEVTASTGVDSTVP